jgi:hypothetical protein
MIRTKAKILRNDVIHWLLSGDVSIQYQVYRDLLDSDRKQLQDRISKEGWGANGEPGIPCEHKEGQ